MWSLNQPPPPSGGGKKKKRGKKKRPELPRIRRVSAQLKTPAGVLAAQLVLNDLTAKGVEFFTTLPLLAGETISITFEHPKRFFMSGQVLWCEELQLDPKIISDTKYKYRMKMQFSFESADQVKTVSAFVEDIQERYLSRTPKAAPENKIDAPAAQTREQSDEEKTAAAKAVADMMSFKKKAA